MFCELDIDKFIMNIADLLRSVRRLLLTTASWGLLWMTWTASFENMVEAINNFRREGLY